MITEQELVTVPGPSNTIVDVNNMVKLTKHYDSDVDVVLYAASYASKDGLDATEPLFQRFPHGKRESITFHRSGLIVSHTDVHCHNQPVRRRGAYMFVYCPLEANWMTWSIGSVTSIAQGKRLIDHILKTGILPE